MEKLFVFFQLIRHQLTTSDFHYLLFFSLFLSIAFEPIMVIKFTKSRIIELIKWQCSFQAIKGWKYFPCVIIIFYPAIPHMEKHYGNCFINVKLLYTTKQTKLSLMSWCRNSTVLNYSHIKYHKYQLGLICTYVCTTIDSRVWI